LGGLNLPRAFPKPFQFPSILRVKKFLLRNTFPRVKPGAKQTWALVWINFFLKPPVKAKRGPFSGVGLFQGNNYHIVVIRGGFALTG